ncbi:MAG: cell wall hydrolase [Thermoanaerobacteraceae bacterium]|nr:cell wall hydrolase [Thermoanaerobacteraceae bacterium]
MKTKQFRFILCTVLILAQFVFVMPLGAAENRYVVKKGDSLWAIAQKYSMTVAELKRINGLTTNIIYPNQVLKVAMPSSSGNYYLVKPGDNLWKIGRRFGTSIAILKSINNLTGNIIYPNQRLKLPSRSGSHNTATAKRKETKTVTASASGYSQQDLYWLARAISAEARGEPPEGQVAVGAVILNRVKNPQFPNTVYAVIFQKVNGVYQFSPVKNGSIYKKPTPEAIKAAKRALQGEDPTNGALYFYNPALTSRSNWIRTRPVANIINNHIFTL